MKKRMCISGTQVTVLIETPLTLPIGKRTLPHFPPSHKQHGLRSFIVVNVLTIHPIAQAKNLGVLHDTLCLRIPIPRVLSLAQACPLHLLNLSPMHPLLLLYYYLCAAVPCSATAMASQMVSSSGGLLKMQI